MKKIFVLFISIYLLFGFNLIYANNNCENEKTLQDLASQEVLVLQKKYDNIETDVENELKGTGATTSYKNALIIQRKKEIYKLLTEAMDKYTIEYNKYRSCALNIESTANDLFDDGIKNYKSGYYIGAIDNFKKYLEYFPDDSGAITNLVLSLNGQGDAYFSKNDYSSALRYYLESLSLDNTNQKTRLNIGIMYYNLKDYSNAKIYLQKAYDYATDSNLIKISKGVLDDIDLKEKNTELLKQQEIVKKQDELKQENIKKENIMKGSVDKVFNKLKNNYSKYSKSERKEKFKKLYNQLSKYDGKFKDEKRIFILKYLKELIEKELKNYPLDLNDLFGE